MPLIKSSSRPAFVANLKTELAAGKPRDQALAIAYSVKRRRRAEGGALWGDVGAAMPENIGSEHVLDPLATVPKRLMWDLPKEMIENAKATPQPGLRREDYTDVPGPQPVDPMIGNSLETAVNMAGIHAPFVKPGTLGAAGGKPSPPRPNGFGEVQMVPVESLRPRPENTAMIEKMKRQAEEGQSAFEAAYPGEKYEPSPGDARHKVEDIREKIRSGHDLPPLAVDKEGNIIDGENRWNAYRAEGAKTVPVRVADEVDHILAAERNLKGPPREPAAIPDVGGAAPAPEAGVDVSGGLGGPEGRGVGVDEAARAAERWAGARKPIEGLPVKPVDIRGHGAFQPGPIGKVHDVAEEYMRTNRPEIAYAPPTGYRPIDPEHSAAIAQAYDDMKHTPNDPATKNAYNAMIDETKAQYDAIRASGLKIEPIPAGMPDPYAANPRLAAHDVAENNHLWFFPTTEGFGTVNKITSNPLLRKMGEIGDHEMTANDMFRVVHDYFGHLKEGHGFRATGEDNAWRSHSAMYSDLARPAMTSETRGQNSWTNYGPHGEKNRTASGADTTYADQKVGLMPDWTMYDKGQAPPVMYHGSGADYLKPDLSRLGSGQGQMAYGAGYYGSAGERVAKRYRDMQAPIQLTRNGQPASVQHAFENMRDSLALMGFTPGRSEHVADQIGQYMEMGYPASKIRSTIRRLGDDEGFEKEFRAALKVASQYKMDQSPGHLYKWAIEANPEHLLNWDAKWKGQTPHVQGRLEEDMVGSIAHQKAALESTIEKLQSGRGLSSRYNVPGGNVRRDRDLFEAQNRLHNLSLENLTGREVYRRSGNPPGQPAITEEDAYLRAARTLKDRGIPGLHYQNVSGGADSGVKNYVIFNPETLRLLRKYGVTGIPAAGVAGAASQQEETRAAGGRAVDRAVRRAKGGGVLHVGPIKGATGGRADKRPMRVPNGAYICTADHVSGMGEGNTEAGMKKLGMMFPKSKPSLLRKLKADDAVPIYAADGEFCINPQDILDRWGDLDHGHKSLDAWQTHERQQLIKTLGKLAPPAQD